MTLTEAIEILEELGDELNYPGLEEDRPAIQLGVEAMKAIQLWRKEAVLGQPTHLPGETEG